jgi:hypothetical protein
MTITSSQKQILLDLLIAAIAAASLFSFWSERSLSERYQKFLGAKAKPEVGKSIGVASVDWSSAKHHLVLLLNADCKHCSESAPFTQHLIEKTSKNVQAVALFPHARKTADAFLNRHSIRANQVIANVTLPWGIFESPTVMVCNERGQIEFVHVGKLSPNNSYQVENDVLRILAK